MHPRRLVVPLAVLAALLAPLAAAQDAAPGVPPSATRATAGPIEVAVWVAHANGTAATALPPGDAGILHVNLTSSSNVTLDVHANATGPTGYALVQDPAVASPSLVANGSAERSWSFAVPAGATAGGASFTVTIDVIGPDGNATAQSTIVHAIAVVPAPVPVPPAPGPNYTLIGGAAAAVLVVGAGAFALTRRRRPKPVPRSATLQKMEMERQAQRARTEEERVAITQQIQESEAQKAQARDLQILKAKRADAEKMIELLEKRLQAGQITPLQHQKMVEKKQADIARIDAEIAEVEARAG